MAEFTSLSSFGEFGSGPGQLSSPAQIAVASNGDLYVADSGNDRVAVFAGDGTFRRAFGAAQMLEPKDVALDGAGRAFVADTGNDRVAVFSGEGAFLFAFGEAELTDPSGVAVDGSNVFVADTGNDRVAVFTDAGGFVDSIEPILSPRDVIVGSDGNLYIASFGDERIDVFTRAGDFLRSFGDEGTATLSGPVALATGAGEILVADQVAERIERFDDDGDFLGGFPAKPGVAGVGAACQGNVFAVEADALFARVVRFGELGTPPPPCVGGPQDGLPEVLAAKQPSNRFHFAGLVKNRRNGSAVLYVSVPGPGMVKLNGRGFRRLSRGAPRAKHVRLPVKPKVRLRRFLKQHGKGRIRVEVTYTPTGGEPRTLEKPILLKRKRG
jgi:NHL repeat